MRGGSFSVYRLGIMSRLSIREMGRLFRLDRLRSVHWFH